MRSVRSWRAGLLLSMAALAVPASVLAQPVVAGASVQADLQADLRAQADPELASVYAHRGWRPLWVGAQGALDPAARALVDLVATAEVDSIESGAWNAQALAAAVQAAAAVPSRANLARAELALSRSFAAYARATRQAPAAEMAYEHDALRPAPISGAALLRDAGRAPSLLEHVREMRWMHPLYAPLRRALVTDQAADPVARQVVLSNLRRIRALPAKPADRYVLVDTASARLWMYEDGRPVDSMRVVVGKANLQTPMMSGYIRHAILNPYWNVPHDLVPSRIAPNVVRRGVSYLKASGYEVLSDYSAEPTIVDPTTVDWRAIAKGQSELRIRQLPGGANAMGRVKYEFPNKFGIYLHDTPEKALLRAEDRQASSGCIRLEDAERLGRWLFRGAMPAETDEPEQKRELPSLVPVYITYLTAEAADGRIALRSDPYRRDVVPAPMFAHQDSASTASLR